MSCSVRECESAHSHEYHIPGWKLPDVEQDVLYIVRICEECKDILENDGIRLGFSKGGGLAFVNEIWRE